MSLQATRAAKVKRVRESAALQGLNTVSVHVSISSMIVTQSFYTITGNMFIHVYDNERVKTG